MFLLQIDQEIFNIMLAKSMHQIARIEFRNAKFPYARGLCPLDPHSRSTIWAQFGAPPFQRLDPPLASPEHIQTESEFFYYLNTKYCSDMKLTKHTFMISEAIQ